MSAAGPSLASLQAQITALKQQMQQVAATAQGGETLQPTYLTVSPTGQVGANFSGVVSASALALKAGTARGGYVANSVQWVRQSDGALVAFAEAWNAAANDELTLQATQATAGDATGVLLMANGLAGSGNASLAINGCSSSGANASTGLFAGAIPKTGAPSLATILDATGHSSFAQTANNLSDLANAGTARTNLGVDATGTACQRSNNLSDVANVQTARSNLGLGLGAGVAAVGAGQSTPVTLYSGSGQVTWAGGSAYSNVVAVNIGASALGSMSFIVVEAGNSGNTGGYALFEVRYNSGTSWNVQGQIPGGSPPSGAWANFYWIMAGHS
jgi:hypothetical protein